MRRWRFWTVLTLVLSFVAWEARVAQGKPRAGKAKKPADAADAALPAAETPAIAEVVKRIGQLGGKIEYDQAKNIVGIDLFERQTTNADLEKLKALPTIERLKLWGVEINDAGAKHLAALPKLKDLVLENTDITDASLEALSRVKTLESLNLRRSTNATDAGLAHLKKLPKL
jgi:hypothetical protein